MARSEKQIEKYLVNRTAELGYWCIKFPPIFLRGFPDRMLLMPRTKRHPAKVVFIELKREGQKPRLIQKRMLERLDSMGFETVVLDSYEAIDAYLLL